MNIYAKTYKSLDGLQKLAEEHADPISKWVKKYQDQSNSKIFKAKKWGARGVLGLGALGLAIQKITADPTGKSVRYPERETHA